MSNSNRAWMPLHIGDYLKDTGHLNATEHGAYLLLIMHYWQNGSLPDNERLIARIARLDAAQWEESRDVLAMLFSYGWTHRRIDAELAKADEIIEKRRKAANKRHDDSKRDARAVHVHSKCSDTGALPITNKPTSETSSEVKRTPRDELQTVLDCERADAVLEHRQRMRKPLTPRAAKLLAAKFALCHAPNAAADAMVANGWQGFEPEWLENRKAARCGQSPPHQMDAVNSILDELQGKTHEPSTTIDGSYERTDSGGSATVVQLDRISSRR